MSYNQWVNISICPINFPLTIKNVNIIWGKFHKEGDKDIEISPSNIKGKVIPENTQYSICACGRDNSTSGTQGMIALFDKDLRIAEYRWNDPWLSGKSESLLICDAMLSYFFRFQLYGIYEYQRPVGSVIIDVFKKE
uniref:Uncharacterized protein n=1 Tax=Arsenophonus endosymbiont of Trialeurodes vaporariorum TaxID=235567 RepID=A0A3B0M240_9GAMM